MNSDEGTFVLGLAFLALVWWLSQRQGAGTLAAFGTGVGVGPFTSALFSDAANVISSTTGGCGC